MDFTEENPLSVSSVGAAVRKNDVEAVKQSIEKGRSIDLKDNRGWAAIHCAASQNYTDCLNVLLEAGADINIRTHEGETPLFLACARNCYEAAVILLEAKSLVNLPNNEDITPLHVVASEGFERLATILLNKQANVNAQDYDSDTPLIEAVRYEHINVCRILLSQGADQAVCGSMKNLPIHHACSSGQLEILKVLLHHMQYTEEYLYTVVNWINSDGFSPLMLAVQSRNLSCVEELLQSGADANIGVCIIYGLTALHLAAYYGNLPILKVILNATSKETIRRSCCNWNGLRSSNRTNLICNAVVSQSEDCLAYLLDCGFESEVLNCPFEDKNPLSCVFMDIANYRPKLRLLEMLLKSGYDPNSANDFYFFLYFLENYSIENELAETFVYKLVDHGFNVDLSYPDTKDKVETHVVAALFCSCIRGGRFRLIPYLLQRSQVTEPCDVLDYILDDAQWKSRYNMNILITFLSHYVDPNSRYHHYNMLKFPMFDLIRDDLLETDIYMGHLVKFPSLKGMARSAIREYYHCVCDTNSHQFKIRLNSLDLPQCLISYLNYEEMLTFYNSLEMAENQAAQCSNAVQQVD